MDILYTSIKNSSSNNNLWKGEQLLVFFVKFRQSMFKSTSWEFFLDVSIPNFGLVVVQQVFAIPFKHKMPREGG
jgi:hypothetical protein